MSVTDIGGLSGSLLAIAPDPARVADLYEILGEFCHAHRNRLNNLKIGLYLAQQSGAGDRAGWKEVEARYTELEGTISKVQGICRPIRLTSGRYDLAALLEDRRVLWADWGLRLDWKAPSLPAFGVFDPGVLGDALDGWARSRVTRRFGAREVLVSWSLRGEEIRLDWVEAGPSAGIDPEDLSLPVLVRVVSAHGGSSTISTEGGLRLSIAWPSDGSTREG